jgi:hypothetical protein
VASQVWTLSKTISGKIIQKRDILLLKRLLAMMLLLVGNVRFQRRNIRLPEWSVKLQFDIKRLAFQTQKKILMSS